MKSYRLACVSLLLWFGLAGGLVAAERHLEFVEGLRDREYYDFAVLYLEQLEARKDVPADVKAVIPYEKALTLLQGVRTVRNPEAQGKQLDNARLFLEQFLKANPTHPNAPQANTELANVLLGKAKVEVQQARSPSNQGQKSKHQEKAREYIAQARTVFQNAHDQYKAAFTRHPTFIDRTKDKDAYDAKERDLVHYIQAQINLAIVTYEEAQTYDATVPEFKSQLGKAAVEFEKINNEYRSLLAGLHARMWQGKCFEEMGDITKALGIYKELLSHGEDHRGPALKSLQDRVTLFRFICLNTEQRKDYQVVVQEAGAWLKSNPGAERLSRIGLGIQWEQARALELLADKPDANPIDQERLYNQALVAARSVNRFPGEYKEASGAAIQRLMRKLNKEGGDPKDFDTAFGQAQELFEKVRNQLEVVKGAQDPTEKKKVEDDLEVNLKETARILSLALSLVNRNKDSLDNINRARFWLCYVYYYMKDKSYESAILGEFLARRYKDANPDVALDAAYLAMAAYGKAYNAAPEDQRQIDVDRMVDICTYIAAQWPNSERTNDARINVGKMYKRIKQPVEAAKWFLQVPETAPQYYNALMEAGQAYWDTYADASVLPEDKRPPKEQLDDWQNKARQTLQDAITKLEAKLPKDAPPDRDITIAKFYLVGILNGMGDYKAALEWTTGGARSLTTAVAVAKGEKRPASGVKSKAFASAVYRELLRSDVGVQQLDKAREAMKELENIEGSGGGGAAVTQIYLKLGLELQKEVKRLQSANDPRLADVLKSFETFLDDMFNRKEGQDYASLVWVGETYYALAEGLETGDKPRAEGYFTRAGAALQSIRDLAAKDPKFIPSKAAETAIKMRLATCKRRQKSFADALQLVTEILVEKPQTLSAQEEAARIYQDWAAAGGAGDVNKWNLAILGDQADDAQPTSKKKVAPKAEAKPHVVWGWLEIGNRLGRNLQQSQTTVNPDLEKQFLEARYNVALCRFKYGMAQSSKQKKTPILTEAMRDINVTASLSENLGGGESWERFNKLHRDILQEFHDQGLKLNGAPVAKITDLEKRIKADATETAAAPDDAPKKAVKKKAKSAKVAKKKKPESRGAGLWIALVLVLLAAGGGGYYLLRVKGRQAAADEEDEEDAPKPEAKKRTRTQSS